MKNLVALVVVAAALGIGAYLFSKKQTHQETPTSEVSKEDVKKEEVVEGSLEVKESEAPSVVEEAATPSVLPELGAVGEFSLVNQENKPLNHASLENKLWIVNFFFTKCTGPCPLMSQKMAKLQKDLESTPEVNFLSISVDPANDTPAVIQEYGKKVEANFQKWTFATGEKAEVLRLAQESFKLPAGETPDMHSTKFVLVDAKGQIRAYYDSLEEKVEDKIKEDIHHLLSKPSA